MATADTSSGGFRRWRRSRPFWGGLLLVISGVELFLTANLTLGDLAVHFGPEGFLSYLLPLLLLLCGVLTCVTPGQRLFYGILGLLTAVYSLIGLNLGGFGLGMLVGIVGGALVIAWAPARLKPAAPETPPATDIDPAATVIVPGFTGDGGLRPQQPGPQQVGPQQVGPSAEPPRPAGGFHRKALVITLVPLAMTAALLVAGSGSPARAETECPEGLPSRPAAAAKKEAARQSSAKASAKARKKTPKASTGAKRSASPSASPTPTATDDSTGNPLVDGWNDFVEGVGDLLGIGDDDEATPSPSASPSPSDTTEPSTSTSADPSGAASSPAGKPEESGTPTPGASSGSASPSPTPSLPDVPCLGARVYKEASADDVPQVSLRGGLLETDSLTMYNSTYDGVVDLPTANGPLPALKFSMTKAVNKPFKLTIAEPGEHTTLIESDELITEGDVRFYTPRFRGNLFGVIPVTFTPETPPPLTLPVLWFTNVRIDLAFVRCDTLTADPLSVVEKP